jgi:hypothetical protein
MALWLAVREERVRQADKPPRRYYGNVDAYSEAEPPAVTEHDGTSWVYTVYTTAPNTKTGTYSAFGGTS